MRFSWLIVPLLAGTLGLRLATGTASVFEDSERALGDAAALLSAHGFATSIDQREGPDAVLAQRQGCDMAVGVEPPALSGVALFQQRYARDRPLTLYYGDTFVEELPAVQSSIDYYLQRLLAPFGIDLRYPPLVEIAAGPGCDLGAIPWRQLQLYTVTS